MLPDLQLRRPQAAVDLTMGWCVLFFPGRMDALSFFVGTEEKRAVGQSENEPALKGARDSFVESIPVSYTHLTLPTNSLV